MYTFINHLQPHLGYLGLNASMSSPDVNEYNECWCWYQLKYL